MADKSAFFRFASRKAIDFSISQLRSHSDHLKKESYSREEIRLNAVYTTRYRAVKADVAIAGKALDETKP
jgi:hypothetical protein